MQPIGYVIQEGRADLHLTVDELADRSHVSAALIWALIEGSPTQTPTDRTILRALAVALDVAPKRLCVDVGERFTAFHAPR